MSLTKQYLASIPQHANLSLGINNMIAAENMFCQVVYVAVIRRRDTDAM